MHNLYVELYRRYVCIGKFIVYIWFGTLGSLWHHPLGILEGIPHG